MSQTFAPFALTLVALTLAACGGGGGGSGTPAVTYTSASTCAGGAALTSTVSQAAANALVPASCPAATAAQLAAITVTRAAAAPSAITAAGLPAGWTLTGGTATFTPIAPTTGAAVTGSISAAGVITPNGTLPAGSYTVAANLTFANAPATSVTRTVVVPAVCTAPSAVNAVTNTCITPPAATGYTYNPNLGGGGAFVANIGVLVTGANTLPAACLTVGDACWVQSVQNGTIKFVNSGAVMTGINTRPIVFAYYASNFNSNLYYYNLPIFADDGTSATLNSVNTGGISGITSVRGTTTGTKLLDNYGICGERYFNGSGFAGNIIACPI